MIQLALLFVLCAACVAVCSATTAPLANTDIDTGNASNDYSHVKHFTNVTFNGTGHVTLLPPYDDLTFVSCVNVSVVIAELSVNETSPLRVVVRNSSLVRLFGEMTTVSSSISNLYVDISGSTIFERLLRLQSGKMNISAANVTLHVKDSHFICSDETWGNNWYLLRVSNVDKVSNVNVSIVNLNYTFIGVSDPMLIVIDGAGQCENISVSMVGCRVQGLVGSRTRSTLTSTTQLVKIFTSSVLGYIELRMSSSTIVIECGENVWASDVNLMRVGPLEEKGGYVILAENSNVTISVESSSITASSTTRSVLIEVRRTKPSVTPGTDGYRDSTVHVDIVNSTVVMDTVCTAQYTLQELQRLPVAQQSKQLIRETSLAHLELFSVEFLLLTIQNVTANGTILLDNAPALLMQRDLNTLTLSTAALAHLFGHVQRAVVRLAHSSISVTTRQHSSEPIGFASHVTSSAALFCSGPVSLGSLDVVVDDVLVRNLVNVRPRNLTSGEKDVLAKGMKQLSTSGMSSFSVACAILLFGVSCCTEPPKAPLTSHRVKVLRSTLTHTVVSVNETPGESMWLAGDWAAVVIAAQVPALFASVGQTWNGSRSAVASFFESNESSEQGPVSTLRLNASVVSVEVSEVYADTCSTSMPEVLLKDVKHSFSRAALLLFNVSSSQSHIVVNSSSILVALMEPNCVSTDPLPSRTMLSTAIVWNAHVMQHSAVLVFNVSSRSYMSIGNASQTAALSSWSPALASIIDSEFSFSSLLEIIGNKWWDARQDCVSSPVLVEGNKTIFANSSSLRVASSTFSSAVEKLFVLLHISEHRFRSQKPLTDAFSRVEVFCSVWKGKSILEKTLVINQSFLQSKPTFASVAVYRLCHATKMSLTTSSSVAVPPNKLLYTSTSQTLSASMMRTAAGSQDISRSYFSFVSPAQSLNTSDEAVLLQVPLLEAPSAATVSAAAAVGIAGGVLIDPSAALDMQLLVGLLDSPCLQRSNGDEDVSRYLLSPFADTGSIAIVLGNIAIVLVVLVVQVAAVARCRYAAGQSTACLHTDVWNAFFRISAAAKSPAIAGAQLPNWTTHATLLLLPGVVKAALGSISTGSAGAIVGGGVVGVGWTVFVVVYALPLLQRQVMKLVIFTRYPYALCDADDVPAPRYSDATRKQQQKSGPETQSRCTAAALGTPLGLPRWLLPMGAWSPDVVRACWGKTFASTRPPWERWTHAQCALSVAFQAIIAAPGGSPRGCAAVFSVAAAVALGMSALMLVGQPMRCKASSIIRGLSSAVTSSVAALLAAMALRPSSSTLRDAMAAACVAASVLSFLQVLHSILVFVVERRLLHQTERVDASGEGLMTTESEATVVSSTVSRCASKCTNSPRRLHGGLIACIDRPQKQSSSCRSVPTVHVVRLGYCGRPLSHEDCLVRLSNLIVVACQKKCDAAAAGA